MTFSIVLLYRYYVILVVGHEDTDELLLDEEYHLTVWVRIADSHYKTSMIMVCKCIYDSNHEKSGHMLSIYFITQALVRFLLGISVFSHIQVWLSILFVFSLEMQPMIEFVYEILIDSCWDP